MPAWRIRKFYGGIATGDKVGIDGSFAFGQGLDIRTNPDLLSVNVLPTKVSSTNVTGLVKWIVQDGTTYYAYADDGKIHSDATNWTSLQTTPNSGGQGLEIFNDYLYYTQNTQLGRYGALSGSPSFTDDYKTGLTDTSAYDFAPMKVFLNKLCIGHGRTIATLESDDTWTLAKITLPLGWNIKSLEVRGDLLYIGAFKGTAITDYEEGALFTWDGTSTTWNSVEFINESGVNALLNQNDTIYVWAGTRGNIYQYVNGQYVKVKKVPNIGKGKYADVFPGAVTGFNGIVHFGMSGNTNSATLYQGVYSWGQVEKNYPNVLNFDYITSKAVTDGTALGTDIKIGAVKAISPTVMYIGWKDGTTYGIDKVDTTAAKYASAFYESLIFDDNQPFVRKTFKGIKLIAPPLASGETIVVKYTPDRGSEVTLGTFSHTTHGAVTNKWFAFSKSMGGSTGLVKVYEMKIKLELTGGTDLVEATVIYDTDEDISDIV